VDGSRVVLGFCGSGGDVMLWRCDGGGVVCWGSRGRCGGVYVNAVGTEYAYDDGANCGRARVGAVVVEQAW
jgi:hypothetical protein